MIDKKRIKYLKKKVNNHKIRALKMCLENGGHISSSFSTAEILAYLYYQKLIKKNGNKFILSKGHGEVLFFSLLADLGYFPDTWLKNSYRKNDCKLGGHVSSKIPGIEFSSGSLGHGLSFSAGLAYGMKRNKIKKKVFCLMGDGELNEGSVWEAVIFSSKNNLSNLIALIDYNKIGSSDFIKNYISEKPLALAWKELGWDVYNSDGHNFTSIHKTLKKVMTNNKKNPSVVIFNTVKGKGVSFIENDPIWHVKGLDKKLYDLAMQELKIGSNNAS